ncbi:ABC transporter permease [Streptomyces sp. NPDC058662]|uniref:ABC transporter permease n=1 Tax=Streptomyces sp. NPDC058662 TaxID=3346583 RepID=UPI0036631B42
MDKATRPGSVLIGHVIGSVIQSVASITLMGGVAVGMASPNADTATNNAMPLIVLPLISSAFVPIEAMPGWFQPIAQYQPFTPAIEPLPGLLLGSVIGHNGWLAIAWCLALTALGYLWSASTFNLDPK